jgi:hypothetical protein
MLNSEKTALDYKDHRKHIRYTFQAKCRVVYVKVGDTYIDHCALNRNTLHYTADLKYKYDTREKRYIPQYGLSD